VRTGGPTTAVAQGKSADADYANAQDRTGFTLILIGRTVVGNT
jgi:hypothetical protein